MHRFNRIPAAALALGSFLLLTGCGDDDDATGPDDAGDQLTVTESHALVEVLMGGGVFIPGSSFSVAATGELQAGSPPFSESFSESESCDLGGTIKMTGTVSGNIDDATGNGNMDMTMDMVHAACKAQASTGEIFTINGAPKLGMTAAMAFGDTSFSYNGGLNGTVKWAMGGKQGTCGIAMSFNMSGDYMSEDYSGSSSGTVCGTDISQSF
ncbi:MAG TPA: hypothetical protein VMK65_11940 [Longimicrobiales bacterium]|nr:hypothetical protein [Longimicrobiales bacterium]